MQPSTSGLLGAAVDDMNDFVAFVAHIQHIRVADFAQVVRLASGRRIESGAVQQQPQRRCTVIPEFTSGGIGSQ